MTDHRRIVVLLRVGRRGRLVTLRADEVREAPAERAWRGGGLFRRMGAMATHTITFPDYSRGDEPRTVVWDDETGEVSGDHVKLPHILHDMERAARDGYIQCDAGRIDVRDPRHDPADFLAVFGCAIGGTFKRVDLPPALRGVKPTQGWGPDMPPGTVP